MRFDSELCATSALSASSVHIWLKGMAAVTYCHRGRLPDLHLRLYIMMGKGLTS